MKKVLRTYKFWFGMASLMIIVFHLLGFDNESIVLIGSSPLVQLVPVDFIKSGFIVNAIGEADVSIYFYVFNVISFVLYGFLFDLLFGFIKSKKVVTKKAKSKKK